jgi:hypothetical protein
MNKPMLDMKKNLLSETEINKWIEHLKGAEKERKFYITHLPLETKQKIVQKSESDLILVESAKKSLKL